ncbi:MAG: NUDIX domain-containing protein [Candidatus Nanohaloarchaea archaeon]
MSEYNTEYPEPVTGALILNENDEIFLMKSPKWENQWLVPGGHVEKGEKIEDCVKREVKEETGLEVSDVEFVTVLEGMPEKFERDTHFIFLNYSCRVENQEVELDQEKAVEYVWIDPQEALESDLDINDSTVDFIQAFLRQE